MRYHIEFTKFAKKQLKKLDIYTQKIILLWLKKNIEGTTDPRLHGKPLSANRIGEWRYRIGDYRIICKMSSKMFFISKDEKGALCLTI